MAPDARWSAVAGRLWAIGTYRTASVHDYAGVLVPLDEAHLYSHSARLGRAEYEAPTDAEDGAADGDPADDDPEDGAGGRRPKHAAPRPVDGDDDDDEPSADAAMLPMRACEYSIEGLRQAVRQSSDGRKADHRRWTDYELKSRLINKAIQDIGMGRYNWQLFVLCGFGWFADNLWMQGVSLILPSLSAEFGVAEKTVRYTTSALFLGLCFGSFFWGIGADVLGRRLAFNCTLLITSVFGTLAAFGASWGAVCGLVAALGFGVGGNLPVDGALFLEFLPDASSALLTLLSVWWPVGQLCSSLLAWLLIGRGPAVDGAGTADGAAAMAGWRRFVLAIGLVTFAMFLVRFLTFRLFESPKFLLSRGRQHEAVAVIHGLAFHNGTKTWLTADLLDAVAEEGSRFAGYSATGGSGGGGGGGGSGGSAATASDRRRSTASFAVHQDKAPWAGAAGAVHARLRAFSGQRLRPLFRTRQLARATATVWFVWATIGMGYPLFNAFLPQYLSHGDAAPSAPAAPPASATYRSYAITSLAGVPGSLLAAYTVDSASPFLGRRGTLAGSTLVSAVFLFLFATLGRSPGSQLLFSCVEAFAQNIMYGVLYAFTPEIFPAPVRGAGTGVASFLNRVTGLVAPVLAATLPGDGSTGPIYLSAVLILSAFFGMVLIPVETRGQQRL